MTWEAMKLCMKRKYLPYPYQYKLFDKLTTLRGGNTTVVEYMNKFEKLKICHKAKEDSRQAISRFKSGLRLEIRLTNAIYSIEEAFQLAVRIEKYLRQPINQNVSFQAGEQDNKESSANFKSNKPAPTPQDGMAKLNTNDLEEETREDSSFLTVIRRSLIVPRRENEDWRRTTIFQTLVSCGKETRKLITDGGNNMNVVFEATVQRLKLLIEPHPQPYKMAWINNASIPVTERCLVSISQGPYSDFIWCDVLPMAAAHVLSGRPWLYDIEVQHNGRVNTCSIMFNNKEIVLKPLREETIKGHHDEKPKKAVGGTLKGTGIRRKVLHFMAKK
ncbi:hypothetical protein CDL12_00415 [Handroanthus impetiginosus]|uniref:Retrotransposon gag domain-containing protein n=1 Tax=Handroanthus impetiginosus TaxID=429701 RepID=A0A2G9IAP7_9LAMI|nr:hypothetical protein CDL12_00415 [Handroanthus impetiginosus]